MRYNTQYSGGMDPHVQTYSGQPLTSDLLSANAEFTYDECWGSAGSTSPTGSEMADVSYPDDNPYVGLFDISLDYLGYGPGCFPAGSNPAVHQTRQVDTGEEEALQRYIHRFTDHEKRQMQHPLAQRPVFMCMIPNCAIWLFNKGQVKQHLREHNIVFQKPFKCTCGSEFGRSVEADRHVEDKRPCDVCHRAGRKIKNSLTCHRCRR